MLKIFSTTEDVIHNPTLTDGEEIRLTRHHICNKDVPYDSSIGVKVKIPLDYTIIQSKENIASDTSNRRLSGEIRRRIQANFYLTGLSGIFPNEGTKNKLDMISTSGLNVRYRASILMATVEMSDK